MPKRRKITMKYASSHRFGLVTIGGVVLRANSIFDPEFAVGGHQPLGHDQWKAFYTRYTVIATKISFFVTNFHDVPCVFFVTASDDPAIPSTMQEVMEAPGFRYRLIKPSGVSYSGDAATGPVNAHYPESVATMVVTMNPNKTINMPLPVSDNSALFDFDPSVEAFCKFGIGVPISHVGFYSTRAYVSYVIEYVVVLSEPVELPPS